MNKTFSEAFPSLSHRIGGIKTPMQKLSCFKTKKKKRKESPGSIVKDLFCQFSWNRSTCRYWRTKVARQVALARRLLSALFPHVVETVLLLLSSRHRARQDYSQVKITAGFREPLEGRGGTGMKLLGVFLKQDTGVCVCARI